MELPQDLYPFYPPLVKVIRPRLQGSMMLRVTTMEILKLNTGWDPAKNMKIVLIDIKEFLASRARSRYSNVVMTLRALLCFRLNLHSDRNNRDTYQDGAYLDIEHHLLRLALVRTMRRMHGACGR